MELEQLSGRWSGHWRTWVEPEELYSESSIDARVETIYGGKVAVVRYTATLDGDVDGLIMLGRTQDGPVASWSDTWHTSGLIMVSHGTDTDGSFEVSTLYRGEGREWRWSSDYGLDEAGRFFIRHYNEGPDVARYLGVEAVMERLTA